MTCGGSLETLLEARRRQEGRRLLGKAQHSTHIQTSVTSFQAKVFLFLKFGIYTTEWWSFIAPSCNASPKRVWDFSYQIVSLGFPYSPLN